ncbi:hypothetical protein D3C85_1384140 [compost metagenome]
MCLSYDRIYFCRIARSLFCTFNSLIGCCYNDVRLWPKVSYQCVGIIHFHIIHINTGSLSGSVANIGHVITQHQSDGKFSSPVIVVCNIGKGSVYSSL